MKKRAIFLDRDGTIIVDKNYLNDPNGIEYLPGAIEGLRLLQDNGFLLIIVTNQSGVARGLVDLANLHKIHEIMDKDLKNHGVTIQRFYYAPHAADSGHPDRKPGPGMLLEGAKEFDIELSKSWMVGDRRSDIDAGHNAGTRSVLLGTNGSPEATPPPGRREAEIHAPDLLTAAKEILKSH